MTNVFNDQKRWMQACSQTIEGFNDVQYRLYCRLIDEEHSELQDAIATDNSVEQLDALIDILVVTLGAIVSMGADGEAAWNEVLRSNLSKIDAETGKVIKRESDGKVLKPSFYIGPELEEFVNPEFDKYSNEQRNLRPYIAENKDGGDF